MGKNTSDVWKGVTTENVFGGTTTFSLSEKIGVLYPSTNSGRTRDKIDDSFFNWTIGNDKYSTYQKVEGDSLQNIQFTDTKILHKIALVKNDTFDNSTVQPLNTISDVVSYNDSATYQLSGNNIRIVNDFDYSDIYIQPKLTIRKFDKSTGKSTDETNLTLKALKEKQETFDTENFDYCIPYITLAILSKKQGGTAGLGNQYCIMSIINLNDIQFICGFGKNGVFGYNEYRYNANLGGIYLNNNGGIKVKNQCYNVNGGVTYNKLETLGYNSYLKADYDTVMEYIASLGFWFYDGEIFYLPEIKNNQTTGKYFPENVLDYVDTENKNWTNTGNIDNKFPGSSSDDELDDSEITLNALGSSFITWYAVNQENLLKLIDYMNSEGIPAGFKPLDHIIGVYQAPFNIPKYCNVGELTNILLGKENTLAMGRPLGNQGSFSQLDIDCNYFIEPEHNNFLDYSPYTQLHIYLPYCGSCELDTNLFIGKYVNVYYNIDIFSGEIIASIYANNTLYKTLSGNFTIAQPISTENVGIQKNTVLQGAIGVGTSLLGTAGFAMSGNVVGALSSGVNASLSAISTYTAINGVTPDATKGGGGRCMFYLPNSIILYKTTAIEVHGNYEKYRGKVCNYDSKLSECHGFTVVDNPHIEIKCTNTERDEINDLLTKGVILP